MHWWEVVGGLADEDRCREVCTPGRFLNADVASAAQCQCRKGEICRAAATPCAPSSLYGVLGCTSSSSARKEPPRRARHGSTARRAAVPRRRRANGDAQSAVFLPATRTATRLISISLTPVTPASVPDPDTARVARRRLLSSVTMHCGNRRDCAEGRTAVRGRW